MLAFNTFKKPGFRLVCCSRLQRPKVSFLIPAFLTARLNLGLCLDFFYYVYILLSGYLLFYA